MLSGLLYEEAFSLFSKTKYRKKGLFPDDVLEIFDDLGIRYNNIKKLSTKQPTLVAIQWNDSSLSGHYIVWDPKREQFLDPLHGLIDYDNMMKLCHIDDIWEINSLDTKRLIKARNTKSLITEMFSSFSPKKITLSRKANKFVIEIHLSKSVILKKTVKKLNGIKINIIWEE